MLARRRAGGNWVTTGLKPPIIILGNTRSGTTVVQKLIAEHPDVVAWYEPRNLWQYADPARGHDEFDATDATDKVKRYIRKRFLAYQRRHEGRRIVEKTPVNILRIPYVREIFPEATYLYIVRSPLSFISSVELKWQRTVSVRGLLRRFRSTPVSQLHRYVAKYIRQLYEKRVLRRKYLSVWGPRYQGLAVDLEMENMLTVVARQWAIPSQKAEKDLAQFESGTVLRLRYEDLVEDPVGHLERIAAHCELSTTPEMLGVARQMIKSDRQDKWRRFDAAELARVIPDVRKEMERHGYPVPNEITGELQVGKMSEGSGSA